MKKVSIIIPFYKVEKYIENCLDSIINQTYNNLEIICIGPCDLKDLSFPIVKKYMRKDKRIKLFVADEMGLGNARNKGLENVTGDYILFIDSDDYIELNCIEKMVAIIEKDKSDYVACGFDRVDFDTKKVYSQEMISNPNNLLLNKKNIKDIAFQSPSAWGKLFCTNFLKDIKFSENKEAVEDLMFMLQYIIHAKKVSYCNEILWHYLVRNNSAVLSISQEKTKVFKSDMISIKEKYKALKLDKSYFELLDLIAFIHGAIAIPTRIYNNKNEKFSVHVKGVKNFLDKNFPNWRKIKIKQRTTKNGIKNFGIYVIKIMYILNIEVMFFFVYNLMIKYLKIDIKW